MQKLLLVYCHSEHRATSRKYFQIWLFPRFGGNNGGVLSMRMHVILDSLFARPGSAHIGGGKKGEFRDWTTQLNARIFRPRSQALASLLPYLRLVT